MAQIDFLQVIGECADRAHLSKAPADNNDRLFYFVSLLAYAISHTDTEIGAKLLDLLDAGQAEHCLRALSWESETTTGNARVG